MAGTVSASNITNITQAESGDSANWDDIGGGPGSGQDANNPIQGSEDRSRRIDNVVRGFSYDSTTASTLTSRHVGFWVFVAQPNLINANGVELILGDAATPQSGNWNGYFFDESLYPVKQGWIRVWLDPSRTRDTGAGTLNLSTGSRQWGCEFDMGDVGGTTPNCHLDRIDTCSSQGLVLTGGSGGAPATFQDLVDADQGSASARYGIWSKDRGVIFVDGPTRIGNASTAVVFQDSGFNLVFGEQELASSTWLTLEFYADGTGNDIDIANGSISSGGNSVLGRVVFNSSSGSSNPRCDNVRLSRLSGVTVNYDWKIDGCTFAECGTIVFNSNTDVLFTNNRIENSTAASALQTVYTGTDTYLQGCEFISGGTGHAIELTSSSAQDYDFDGCTFTGYAASNGSTGNEAIWVRATTGTVNITISNGNTPSIRTDGATVNVTNAVSHTVTNLPSTAEVTYVRQSDGAELYHVETVGGTGTVTYAYNYVSDVLVDILIHDVTNNVADIDNVTLSNANQTVPAVYESDRVYDNPT